MKFNWEVFSDTSQEDAEFNVPADGSVPEDFNVPQDGIPKKFTMGVNWTGQHFDFSKFPEFLEVDGKALHGKKLDLKLRDVPGKIEEGDKYFYYLGVESS